ncbi:MAG: NAD-dependent dehydratase [Microbacteriaceae bacterium]|jgi:nucleoside-diphosphate-sugar epimerase|nr:NAD-dependent dehydratase [Microbacteriaceae bacterium]
MSLRVLFLGGAGMIGSAVAAELEQADASLTVVTRSEPKRVLPLGTETLRGDVRSGEQMRELLGAREFDVVVNWVGFEPDHIRDDVDLYRERAGQYVFISTCSVFARPVPQLPITESSPRRQAVFGYGTGKVACEVFLEEAYREKNLPLTIIRPFHTYDRTTIPVLSGWTAIERMRADRGVIVHGDGTSLWTLMHSSDFARAVVPILGNQHAIGESVNVVSGDILSWDQIHTTLAAAAGVRIPKLVHRSSESIAKEYPGWGEVLEHDFRHSMLFDSSKLQSLSPGFAPRVSFSQGAREIVAYHEESSDRRRVNTELDAAFDRLIEGP